MKMKRNILFIALVLTSFACRKEEINKFEGPSIDELNSPFTVVTGLESSRDSVDFQAGENVFFSAVLSKTIAWQLRIVGEESGAEKIVTGLSKTIDETSYTWEGSTTNLPMFRTENCRVELTFAGEPDTLTTTVKVVQPKVNSGFVVADFDSGFNPGWTFFFQSGLDMNFSIITDGTAPQGNKHYNMQGTVDWDYLIGLINFKASAYGSPTYPLNANPDNVYFNVMIYGDPVFTNSIVLFQFEEDEDGNGTFTSASEDMYSLEVKVDWIGWKLVSIKYSDIPSLVSGAPSPANGNAVHNSDRISSINMLHLANPATGKARSKLDYLIFTENGPLLP
jgi:hypothetical protein